MTRVSVPDDHSYKGSAFDYAEIDRESIRSSGSKIDGPKSAAATGTDAWKAAFQAGAALIESTVIGKRVVYQYAGDKGLYAIDKQTGKKVWQLENAVALLTEAANTAYVIADPPLMIVMDNLKAKKLYSVNFAGVSKYAVNTTDSTMYASNDSGKVMSISLNR